MAKKNKIPLKIAGVKIPKVFRKNSLAKTLLGNAVGRQVVADALLAAATAGSQPIRGCRKGRNGR